MPLALLCAMRAAAQAPLAYCAMLELSGTEDEEAAGCAAEGMYATQMSNSAGQFETEYCNGG